MNVELNKICANNAELRSDIQHMLDRRREMSEEYNQLSLAMQNATDESRQLTSECSESFANRYEIKKN
jgi:predicted  nucleic acid-binding Zn-ribbon protein